MYAVLKSERKARATRWTARARRLVYDALSMLNMSMTNVDSMQRIVIAAKWPRAYKSSPHYWTAGPRRARHPNMPRPIGATFLPAQGELGRVHLEPPCAGPRGYRIYGNGRSEDP